MGSQTFKRDQLGRGKRRIAKDDRPEGGIGGTESILPSGIGGVKDLLARKEFRFAARVALGTMLKMTGTDLLASAVIAAAKGYQEAEKHGLESGVEKATVEFVKGQVVGAIADGIASSAVQYATSTGGLELDRAGKEIVTDAVASAIVAL